MIDEEFKKLLHEAITTEELRKLSESENLSPEQREKASTWWYDSYCTDIITSMGR